MTLSKKIVVAVMALLVLSLFANIAIAKERKGPKDQPGIQSVAPVVSQSLESHSRNYELGNVNSCLDAKLKRGDTASFVFDGNKYSLRQGLVGNRYTQLSFQGNNERFYSGDAKKYDLDLDGKDDLQLAVYELFSGNAFLSVCGLQH